MSLLYGSVCILGPWAPFLWIRTPQMSPMFLLVLPFKPPKRRGRALTEVSRQLDQITTFRLGGQPKTGGVPFKPPPKRGAVGSMTRVSFSDRRGVNVSRAELGSLAVAALEVCARSLRSEPKAVAGPQGPKPRAHGALAGEEKMPWASQNPKPAPPVNINQSNH